MRSMWIISPIIAIGLTTSAPAQGVDQNTKQQIEQIIAAYHDAWNNHNAAGIAGLYTRDGILVTQAPQIVKHGQQDIEKNYEGHSPRFLIMIRQQPMKLYHLEPVNLCLLVNATSPAVAIISSMDIGLRCMCRKRVN
jgi:hypothetical protein